MRRLWTVLLIFALTGTGVLARGRKNKQPVTVYIDHGAMISTRSLSLALALAHDMFAPAGVDLKWRPGRPELEPGDIVIQITSNTPASLHPDALAYARPFDGVHVRIFYDRVAKMGDVRLAPRVLAHVMVHEITHNLQGIDHHSTDGVMKAIGRLKTSQAWRASRFRSIHRTWS